jgi:hypothetical protein
MNRSFGLLFGALALALSVAAVRADAASGSLRLDSGDELTWSLADQEAQPALGIALPATIAWANRGIDGPVEIDLSTNYAAFIERWELALYRQSDTKRRHPLMRWRGAAAGFDAGVVWDGTVESGPPLRPGEAVVALLRVRDLAGNIDEAQPQTMQVSRYLMPKQKRKFEAVTRDRRAAVASGAPPAIQTIPVNGRVLTVDIGGNRDGPAYALSGLPMDAAGAGRWTLSQVVPSGSYRIAVQSERPILGGTRLVTVGRIPVEVPRGRDLFVGVKGTGDLQRLDDAEPVAGLAADGTITGHEAVRLTLWSPDDPMGRLALALADPAKPGTLYRDNRGRSIARIRPSLGDIPWGAKDQPREAAEPVKMRARFSAVGATDLYLPHTDIDRQRIFVSYRTTGASPVYLIDGEHFELDPLQGRLFVTGPGRSMVRGLLQNSAEPGVIEVAYTVRPSIAGMATRRPSGPAFEVEGNGEAEMIIFGPARQGQDEAGAGLSTLPSPKG